MSFKSGDKVRFLTEEEIDQSDKLKFGCDGDIWVVTGNEWRDSILTVTKDEYELATRDGAKLEILRKDAQPNYYVIIVELDGLRVGRIEGVRGELLVAVESIQPENSEASDPIDGFFNKVDSWIEQGRSGLCITPNGAVALNAETNLEKARKIMKHAVEQINALGVVVTHIALQGDTYPSLENAEGVFISKDSFGQDEREDKIVDSWGDDNE